ncbi:helix-turn-helix domain-containing protein [Streptomyces sp. N2A]|uniref:AraC-like ligand-binding domain-containing protein n=1 Tax=Streptomyces sp. N2A TaxID=3073936 RepID=UPI0028704899|nr:helix-turn-helix domain-containing protein [Streptomyces sp. N2A]
MTVQAILSRRYVGIIRGCGTLLVTDFRTDVVSEAERFPLFEEVAAQTHMRNWLCSEQEDDFRATMRVLSLGDVQVTALAFPQLGMLRTPKLIRQGDPEVYQMNCALKGDGAISQHGRDAKFRAGEFVLVDSSHPYRGSLNATPDCLSSLVLTVPRAVLPLPQKTVQRMSAVPVPLNHGMGGVFYRWLSDINARANEFTPADIPTLTSVTVDLLASMLGHCLDTETALTPESRRRALHLQIRDFTHQHLSDPALSPATLAAAHQISLRYLHQLFAAEGTTPAAWIRRSRLERCRRDLANPRLCLRPIHAIAARWGFTDPAHFSRAFRATYGTTPRDYRHHALHRPVHDSTTDVCE